jgi:hypothetical protein
MTISSLSLGITDLQPEISDDPDTGFGIVAHGDDV